MMADANAKINAAPAALPAATPDGKPAVAPPFDIAKVAGIFAAVGVAVGMIGTALSGLSSFRLQKDFLQIMLSSVLT